MSSRRYRLLLFVSALACLALLAPATASAGVSIGIGIGTTIGPHHPHHVHGWYGGWYGWPHYYWYDPWYDPWWYYPAPVVLERPVVRERVVVRESRPTPPPKEKTPDLVAERLQQKKSEQLKRLRIGDADSRRQAVTELEPFAGDSKVRTTLEQALLSDRDPQVRKAVAELFGRLRDTKTLPVLRQANKDDSDREVRQAAYKAIIMMEGY
ncbi:MAG: HEAT repeat domain-containing protein [Planctomycetes bacterium]|nr:HEAT repeat domain-containing protein [Planctomycetota bacterium]